MELIICPILKKKDSEDQAKYMSDLFGLQNFLQIVLAGRFCLVEVFFQIPSMAVRGNVCEEMASLLLKKERVIKPTEERAKSSLCFWTL